MSLCCELRSFIRPRLNSKINSSMLSYSESGSYESHPFNYPFQRSKCSVLPLRLRLTSTFSTSQFSSPMSSILGAAGSISEAPFRCWYALGSDRNINTSSAGRQLCPYRFSFLFSQEFESIRKDTAASLRMQKERRDHAHRSWFRLGGSWGRRPAKGLVAELIVVDVRCG